MARGDGLVARIPAPDLIAAALVGVALFAHVLASGEDFLGSGTDLVSMEAPLAAFARGWIERGVLPLWNPYIAGGVPLPGATSAYFSPLFWLGLAFSLPTAIQLGCTASLALAGAGAAWLARPYVSSRRASALGGALFASSGFLVAHLYAGHLELVAATAFMPWMVGVVDRVRRRRRVPWSAAVACFAAGLLASHYQMFAFACLAAAALAVGEEIATPVAGGVTWRGRLARGARPVGVLALLALGGALVAAVQMVPLAEVLPFTQRRVADLSFATSFAAVPATWMGLFLPRLFGPDGSLTPTAELAPWEIHGYVGLVTLALAAYAIGALPRARWLGPTLAASLGALLAMGDRTPALRILVTLAPPFERFRAPGRYLVFLALFGSLLAAIGLDALLREEGAEAPADPSARRRLLLAPAGVLAAALALAAWLGSTSSGAFASTMSTLAPVDGSDGANARLALEHARDDAYLAVVILAVALGAIVAAATAARRSMAAWTLVGVALLDTMHAGRPFLRTGPHAAFEWFAPIAGHCRDAVGLGGRILPTPELAAPDVGAPYDLATLTGYSVFFDDRAARYAKRALGLPLDSFLGILQSDGASPLWRPLGAGLILTSAPRRTPDGRVTLGMGAAHEVGGLGRMRVLALDAPAPRVAIAHSAEVVDEETAYARMSASGFDVRDVALLEPGAPVMDLRPAAADAHEGLEITAYEPNSVTLAVNAASPGLAILSDVYEPGWTARVDGASAEVVPVDRVMRGVPVPTGRHEVVLRYWPPGFTLGIALSCVATLLLLAVAAAELRAARRRRASPATEAT